MEMASMDEIILCPSCQLPAKLMAVLPSTEPAVDEETYRCPICNKDFKQNVRAKSMDGPR